MQRNFMSVVMGIGLVLPAQVWAQTFNVDNPPTSFLSTQSGTTTIAGWHCEAETSTITVRFTTPAGSIEFQAAAGTSRGDTVVPCEDENNGFALLWNWNLFDDGQVLVEFLINGAVFASATVKVVTLGAEFVPDASDKTYVLNDFPFPGQNVTVQWLEPLQNFVIVEKSNPDSPPDVSGEWVADGSFASENCNGVNPSDLPPNIQVLLELTQQGSSLSGTAIFLEGDVPFPGADDEVSISGSVESNNDFVLTSDPVSTTQENCMTTVVSQNTGNFLDGDVESVQTVTLSGMCPGLNNCNVVYSGTIER